MRSIWAQLRNLYRGKRSTIHKTTTGELDTGYHPLGPSPEKELLPDFWGLAHFPRSYRAPRP